MPDDAPVTMRAATYRRYGGPEVLEVTDLPVPKVGPDFVLVATRAAGVNPVDWKVREGYLDGAFSSHFPIVPGWDLSGVVEAVGPSVTEFAPGDEVIGYVRRDEIQHGTTAEKVAAPVRTLARKPRSVGFVEAAGLPLAGLTALQCLDAVAAADGDVVLVHNASGGVGGMAVQIARSRGARVLGTCSQGSADHVRALGAEPLDYAGDLVAQVHEVASEGVDAVLDFIGGDALALTPKLLRTGGRVASVVDAATVKELGGHYVFVRPSADGLTALADLVDAGSLRIPVAATFPLDGIADAHRLVAEGHVRGKVVVEVASG